MKSDEKWREVLLKLCRLVSIDVTEAACLTHMYNDQERAKLNQASKKLSGQDKKDKDNALEAIFGEKETLTCEEFVQKVTKDVEWIIHAPKLREKLWEKADVESRHNACE